MKKLKKAFVYALIVTVVINGIGSLINILIYDLNKAIVDILYIAPVSFPLFFVPCFFSVIYFRDTLFKNVNTTIKPILKPVLFSFIIILVLVLIVMNLKKGFNISYLTSTALPNAVFAIIISLFSTLVLFLLNKPHTKTLNEINTKPSITVALIHFFWVTLAYFSLITFNNSSFAKFHILFNTFISGLLVVLFVYFSLQHVINKAKSKYWIIAIYIIATFVIPSILSLINSNITFEIFVIKIKVFLSVSTPYFLFLTLVIHTYYIYLKNKSEKQNLKQIGVEASLKYQQLKSQISPHFLFNNISVLTGLIEEDKEKAIRFSEDLSKVYRYFLDQETQDLVTLKDEISFADKYIALLKVRFENALIFINEVEENEAFYILPMALQQVLENVVKHNELSIENPIAITLSVKNDFLIISNTLHPKLTIETTKPTGLENIKNRYAYFTDEKLIIIKDDNLFTIKLPLLKPEA
ncbi:sensor histidine kinase [Lacinutrix mariniflava]|uniref:sensor histidine kinase n=1 Tax=Lacinutrix mariniflava TaxID=342955 RepID=UPI0006E27E8E|nr:histidine kinase [Lacinutrix mariniflava]